MRLLGIRISLLQVISIPNQTPQELAGTGSASINIPNCEDIFCWKLVSVSNAMRMYNLTSQRVQSFWAINEKYPKQDS